MEASPDRLVARLNAQWTLLVAICVLLVLIFGAALWAAGEAHYQSCVDQATATTGVGVVSNDALGGGSFSDATGFAPDTQRVKAVNGCSRLPW